MHEPRTDDHPHDRIRLTGLAATGHHGVLEHERRDGQTFVADVALHVDTRPAAAEDRLDLTVHYGVLAEQVVGVLGGEPADLVETVAERIAAVALTHPAVLAVDVVLHKPQAPIPVPFADVTVEIHRDRSHLPVVSAPPVMVVTTGAAEAAPEELWPTPAEDGWAEPAEAEEAWLASSEEDDDEATGETISVADLVVPALVPEVAPPAAAPAPDLLAPGPLAPDHAAGLLAPDLGVGPGTPPVTAALASVPLAVEPADRLHLEPEEPVEVVLALGSNTGASQETLRQAVRDLDDVDGLDLTAVSPLARTAAVGGPEQPDFLNAVVLGVTTLSPRGLLRACQGVEAAHGRVREEHWGPRTLDVDIVLHGSTMAVTDDLELPHPRAHERAFVLVPWAEVDPEAVLPGLGGGPVAALAETAPDREGIRWMALDWWRGTEGPA
ncbi:2-amino-4-hydroxy-6-hydroxymethyldihydropteridine diphosphokinase [Actinotalea sp. BY-33]|uniref:Bifunctional folate synthesis protein n=1 Tax=Actinotalea soli TaxID=2819234 RepID=A0A939LRZ0_9CELL|nr:2-amino-4-hydroxy-6-hydroxymethyldihydropteridine diphosphokinase [Actinotalea soli]MBO1752983.1 2-amino-4-hydroxy-6-hydroxymethyldihydropteridine diphosphokinase [Actinotalea soli]